MSFLNEHFIPDSIREIDDEWKYTESKQNALHTKAMPFFEDMMEEGEKMMEEGEMMEGDSHGDTMMEEKDGEAMMEDETETVRSA